MRLIHGAVCALLITAIAAALLFGCSRQSTSNTPTAASTGARNIVAATRPRPASCVAGDLRITIGEGDGAAGHYYAPLRFNNTGTAACTLIGWPRLFYVAGDRLNQVGKAAKKIGDIGNAVILQPGDIAHADVDEVNVHNYANSACHIMSVRGLRIYPPHSKKSVFLQQSSRDACANKRLPGEQLQVKAIKPGPGSR